MSNKYNIMRLIGEAAGLGVDAGYEREVSQELAISSGRSANGFFVPHGALSTRAITIDPALSADNAPISAIQSSDFIDALRAESVLGELGVQFLTGLQGEVSRPVQSATTSATFQSETSPAAEVNPSARLSTLRGLNLVSRTSISVASASQASYDVQGDTINDMNRSLSLAMSQAVISGMLNGPSSVIGLEGTVRYSAFDPATLAVPATFLNIVQLEADVLAQNYSLNDTTAYVANARTLGMLKTTLRDAGSAQYLLQDGMINGYKAVMDNTMTDGYIAFGDFANITVGLFGAVDLTIDPFTNAGLRLIDIHAHQLVDAVSRFENGFSSIRVEV